MQLTYLQYFVETIKCRSINKAALNLHVDPSTISVALRSLESELGIKLLIRSRNGTSPTPQGIKVFEDAQKMLELYESWKQPTQPVNEYERIQIATSHLAYNTFCSEISLEFASESLPIVPVFNVGFCHTILNTDADFLISSFSYGQELNQLNAFLARRSLQNDILIPQNPFAVFINKHHPLAAKSTVCKEDLVGIPFIYFSEKFTMEPTDPRAVPITFKANEHSQILQLVENNKGYTILPSLCRAQCQRLMFDSIVTIPITGFPLTTTFCFAHPPYSSLSRNAKAFINYVKDYCNRQNELFNS